MAEEKYIAPWDKRGQGLIDEARLQAEAMHLAPSGECLHDTFHAFNWSDKPHRVVYDAVRMIRALADELVASREREAELQRKLDKAKPAVAAMGAAIFALIAEQPERALDAIRSFSSTLSQTP